MDFFFNPSSIAVIGASARKTGASLLANVCLGYSGPVYPVNPGYTELQGLACYPSIEALPAAPDLAIVLVPAGAAPGVIQACAKRGVKGIMIESAGFAEVGAEGRKLQERCAQEAREGGVRLWGPNCMGLVDVVRGYRFTFMHPKVTEVVNLPGRISLVVQSGMLSAGFLGELMSRRGMGVAKVCSIGNRADVDECDILEQLLADGDTDAVGFYLESLARPRRFLDLARTSPKPLVGVLGGQSQAGARAARSHTASLAGDARLTRSLLQGAGVIIAEDFHHLADLAQSLAMWPRVAPGARAAVLTYSGGAGILTCDLLARRGLGVAELGGDSLRRLQEEVFPPWMAPGNPVDLYPAMERLGRLPAFMQASEIVLADPGVDALIIHYFAGLEDQALDVAKLKRMADQAGKALGFWCLGLREDAYQFARDCQAAGVPLFSDLARCVEGLSAAVSRSSQVTETPAAPAPPEAPTPAGSAPGRVLDEFESKRLLASYGVPVVDEVLIDGPAGLDQAATRLGWPVVLKGLAPDTAHKSERGLVITNLGNDQALQAAYQELTSRLPAGSRVLLQKQVPGDYELMAGLVRDEHLGPCLLLGRGGVLAELEPDVVFAPTPLDRETALALPDRLRCARLLNGFRHIAPLDRESLSRLLLGLSRLASERPDIASLDINPLIIAAGRPVAVDAGLVLAGDD